MDPLELDTLALGIQQRLDAEIDPPNERGPLASALSQYTAKVKAEGREPFSFYLQDRAAKDQRVRGLFASPDVPGLPDGYMGPDKEAHRQRTAGVVYLSHVTGRTPKDTSALFLALRDTWAKANLGKDTVTDGEFFGAISKRFAAEDAAAQAATQSAFKNVPRLQALREAQAANADGWTKAAAERFTRAYDAHNEALRPYRGTVAQIIGGLKSEMGVTKGAGKDPGAVAEMLMAIPEQDRGLVIQAIQTAGAEGEDNKGVLQKLGENVWRGAVPLATNWIKAANRQDLLIGLRKLDHDKSVRVPVNSENPALDGALIAAGGEPDGGWKEFLTDVRPMTKEERAAAKVELERMVTATELAREIQDIAEGKIDPATSNSRIVRGMYGAARSVPTMVGAIIPGGQLAIAGQFVEDNYHQLRRDNPGMSRDSAQTIAALAAPIQTASEVFVDRFIVGRFPTMARMFKSPVTTWPSVAGRIGLHSTGGMALETGEEVFQDLAPYVVQDAVAALSADVPGVDWAKVLESEKKALPEILATVPWLVIAGSGAANLVEMGQSRHLATRPDLLEAAGWSSESAGAIAEAAKAGDWAKAQGLMREDWNAGKVQMDGAKLTVQREAAVQSLKQDAANQQQAEKTLEQIGALPSLRRTESGWQVRDGDTSVDYPTHQEASDARWKVAEDRGVQVHQTMRDAFSQMERNAEAGREFAIEFSPEEMTLGRAVETGIVSEKGARERVEIAGVVDEDADFQEASAMSRALAVDADDALAAQRVLGMNRTEFKEGVMRTTVRLFQGATPLTAIEEKLEGDASKLMAEGRRDWMVAALRDYERKSGDKLFRSADDSKLTDNDVREAWSHLGQSYFVSRSRKGDGSMLESWKAKGFRQVFADVMRSKVGASMSAYASFFRAVWRRASKLGKVRREGKLGAELEAELARQLGLEQGMENAKTVQEAEKMAGELAADLDPDNAPFSLMKVGGGTIGYGGWMDRHGNFHKVASFADGHANFSDAWIKDHPDEAGNAISLAELGWARVVKSGGIVWVNVSGDALTSPQSRGLKRLAEDHEASGGDPVSVVQELGATLGARQRMLRRAPEADGFSLAPGELDARLAKLFDPFQKSPELRARVVAEMKRRLGKMTDDFRDVTAANRAVSTIEREARFREADAAERIERDLTAAEMSPDEVAALEASDEAKLRNHPLVDALLTGMGRLMSRTAAMKAGKLEWQHGDYDGAPSLPSWMWGGKHMPDTAAQFLYEQGLLRDAYPDTLWNELSSAIASTQQVKERHEKAQAKMKAIRKRAREEAKKEVKAWKDAALKAANSKGADRARMLAAMRAYNAIISALPAEVRGRLGGYLQLAEAATDEKRLDIIEDRVRRADELLEKHLRKEYREQVEKLFDQSKLKHESGKKAKSTLGAEAYSLIQTARAAQAMDPVKAAAEIAAIDATIAGGTLTPEQEFTELLRMELIRLFADWKNADSARMEAALEALKWVRTDGLLKRRQQLIDQRERREKTRVALMADTGSDGAAKARKALEKQASTLLGGLGVDRYSLSSFSEVVRAIFGEKSKAGLALIDAERNASNQYEDEVQDAGDAVADLFTRLGGGVVAGERMRYDMSQPSIKVDVPALAGFSHNQNELSQLEAIQMLLMWRQSDGQRHMEGPMDENGKPAGPWHYTQAWIDEVENQLTPDALEVMAFLQADYGKEWGQLNPLYQERHGVSLPRNDRYAPLTVVPKETKGGGFVDPLTGADVSGATSITPGSLRTRNTNVVAEPRRQDALATWLAHKRQMAYWKSHYDLVTDMQAVLGNREVGNSIEGAAGQQAVTVLRRRVEAIALGGVRDAAAGLSVEGKLKRMASRAATMALFGRVSTLLVQSTQLAAASVKMPVGAYLLRFSKLLSGQLGWGDAIRSPFIQRRIKQAPPIVQQAMESLASAKKPNLIKHAAQGLGKLLSGADGLFTAGTYAILLDYHKGEGAKLGVPDIDAYAHQVAERDAETVAQPTRASNRSIKEITETTALGRLAWAFASESRQKVMLFAWAFKGARTNPAQFLKTGFLTFVVGGLFTQVLKNLWREAKGDDDEEKWSAGRLGTSMMLAPLSGIPGVDMLAGKDPLLSRFAYAGHSAEDFLEGDADLRDVENLMWAAGLFNDTAAGVNSLWTAGNEFAGVLLPD